MYGFTRSASIVSCRHCLFVALLGAALPSLALTGCGGKKEVAGLKPATGTVVYNGQPVAGCTVTFAAPFSSAFGITDEKGRFQLRTAQGEGAPPGDYQVTVVKTDSPPPQEAASEADYRPPEADPTPPPEPKDLLPAKYKQPETSALTATVSDAGPNDFTFTLTD